MSFDTNISLDLVIILLALLGAVWRIEHALEIADNEALRSELKAEIAKSHMELKAENAELREDKVDESNQRIARLEGIILAREGMVDTIVE